MQHYLFVENITLFSLSLSLFDGLGWIGSIRCWVRLGWVRESEPTSMRDIHKGATAIYRQAISISCMTH